MAVLLLKLNSDGLNRPSKMQQVPYFQAHDIFQRGILQLTAFLSAAFYSGARSLPRIRKPPNVDLLHSANLGSR